MYMQLSEHFENIFNEYVSAFGRISAATETSFLRLAEDW